MKNVWIFHHYATPPNKGGLVRAYDFGKQLIKKGYKVKIFASAFNHFTHENIETGKNGFIETSEEGVPFVWVKTSVYKGNGFDRIKNMISFYQWLPKVVKKSIESKNQRPDVIIASSAHPLTCVAGIKIAKKLKIPCIVEIRDLWPESIVEYSSRLTKKNPIIRALYKLEKWIYKKADKIIFTMEGGKDYIIDQGWNKEINLDKIYHINNGVDLEKFDFNKEHFKIEDEDLKNDELIKLIYTGSIRKVNNVGLLLDVAKEIKDSKIKFLIWGDGNELKILKDRVVEEEISNVVFKGRVDKKYIPYILSKGNFTIILGENKPIYKYGISPNKLFEYFSAGKPVLQGFEVGYDLVTRHNCGVLFVKENFARTINKISKLSEKEKIEMNVAARNLGKTHDYSVLTEKLIDIIEEKK